MILILVYVIASNLGGPQASDLFDLHFLLEHGEIVKIISYLPDVFRTPTYQELPAGHTGPILYRRRVETACHLDLDFSGWRIWPSPWSRLNSSLFFLWSFFDPMISYDDFIWYLELKIMILWYWQHLGEEQIAWARGKILDPIKLHGSCSICPDSPFSGFQSMLNEALKGNSPVLPNVGWHRSMKNHAGLVHTFLWNMFC